MGEVWVRASRLMMNPRLEDLGGAQPADSTRDRTRVGKISVEFGLVTLGAIVGWTVLVQAPQTPMRPPCTTSCQSAAENLGDAPCLRPKPSIVQEFLGFSNLGDVPCLRPRTEHRPGVLALQIWAMR
jgi:hypothetical protein